MSSQAKKIAMAQAKVAGKRSRSATRTGRIQRVQNASFQAAVSKAIVKQKEKTSTGYVDTGAVGAAVAREFNASGYIDFVSGVSQGDSETKHPNKKFLLKGLYVRGALYNKSAGTSNLCSLVVVQDLEPTGSTPAVTDIFTACDNIVYAQLNPAGSARFRILHRRNWALNGTPSDSAQAAGLIFVNEYFDLKKIEVTTKTSSNDIGSVQKNAIYLLYLGNNATGTSAAQMNFSTRLTFIDL